MTFWGVFWASRGRIWMKIGGNQAEAFPDLPIQPRNLDVDRKTRKIAIEISKQFADFYPTNFREISRIFPGNFGEMSGNVQGHFPDVSRKNSGKFPGNVREISGKIPGNFREISGKSPGNFREMSGKFPGNFREISRTFPGNFREISWTFPENFRGKFLDKIRKKSRTSRFRIFPRFSYDLLFNFPGKKIRKI